VALIVPPLVAVEASPEAELVSTDAPARPVTRARTRTVPLPRRPRTPGRANPVPCSAPAIRRFPMIARLSAARTCHVRCPTLPSPDPPDPRIVGSGDIGMGGRAQRPRPGVLPANGRRSRSGVADTPAESRRTGDDQREHPATARRPGRWAVSGMRRTGTPARLPTFFDPRGPFGCGDRGRCSEDRPRRGCRRRGCRRRGCRRSCCSPAALPRRADAARARRAGRG